MLRQTYPAETIESLVSLLATTGTPISYTGATTTYPYTVTNTGVYRVTKADTRAGEVLNRSVATAENGTVRSNEDEARADVKKKPCQVK
ncbi:hypothetical protein ACIQRK_07615 [Streptomyces anulatus]